MLKVLLVDDEPFILQGLQIIIDWAAEGFEIAAIKANGKEALEYLKNNKVDLIISDIQMPIMTGLELLETIRKENISDARFVILSGYDNFSYTQKAIRNDCMDYILKPVQAEDLLSVIRNVSKLSEQNKEMEKKQHEIEDAYNARNIIALLKGKYDEDNLEYVNHHLAISEGIRYIDIEIDSPDTEIDMEEDDTDRRILQRQLLEACRDVLKENANHFIFDVSYDEKSYDVGFVFCNSMALRHDQTEKEFLNFFMKKVETIVGKPVRLMCGKSVPTASALSKSYSSCCMLNSIKGFHDKKNIYIYEEEAQVERENNAVLCKNSIDGVISAIESNNSEEIDGKVEELYQEMQKLGANSNTINLNINYLLFQLIHLASEQDDEVNQEEVVQYITENSFEDTVARGSIGHMKRFAKEYAEYLMNLRKNVSRGIIADIEKEIREHYSENISLRDLGEKYYMNSSYLGQIFRKKYNQSFKDYLTSYRIHVAAKELVHTDKKINQIAEEVGYRDSDYFIRKFIEINGCTPSKYRKKNREE